MLFCLGAPEVFHLPCLESKGNGYSVNDTSETRYPHTDAGAASVTNEDSIINVSTSHCGKYLFVLSQYAFYIYSAISPNFCIGRLVLTVNLRKKYERFRDLALIPGLPWVCILLNKRDKVLVISYEKCGLGALYDRSVQSNSSSYKTGNDGRNRVQSAYAENTPLRMSSNLSLGDPLPCTCITKDNGSTTRSIRGRYEEIVPRIQVKVLYVLSIPASVQYITCAEGQFYFWASDQLGVYATTCAGGFANYLLQRSDDHGEVEINLNLHGTNLIKNMTISGNVTAHFGLCYLLLNENLYLQRSDTDNGKIFVIDTGNGKGVNSLMDWINISSTLNDSEDGQTESDAFDTNPISADSLLTDIESSVAPELCDLEDVLDCLIPRRIIMNQEMNYCLVVTESGGLLSLYLKNNGTDCIGLLIYSSGINHIAAEGNSIVISTSSTLIFGLWQKGALSVLWSYNVDNIRSIAICNRTIAVFYNQEGLYCFNSRGNVMLYRRSKVELSQEMSACFAVRGLSLIATEGLTFIKYNLYRENLSFMHCSTPHRSTVAFTGEHNLLTFQTYMLDCTFGIPSKFYAEDRNWHSYDNSDLIGDLDCTLHTIQYGCLEPQSGRWPVLNAVPSPSGDSILCATDYMLSIVNRSWKWFGHGLGNNAGMGWLNNDVCFVFITLPVHSLQSSGTSDVLHSSLSDLVDFGGIESSYCYFFHIDDLNSQLEIIPLKAKPLCSTVYKEVLYIADSIGNITGYQLVRVEGSWKFDQVSHLKHTMLESIIIEEIYYLNDNLFAILDNMGGLYRLTPSDTTKIMDDCSSIITTVHECDTEPVLLLCSNRSGEKPVIVTSLGNSVLDVNISCKALVDQGIVSYLFNILDSDDKVQKLRIAKTPLPVGDLSETKRRPFTLDIFDKMLSNVTHMGDESMATFMRQYTQLPFDMQQRLVARHSRRHYAVNDINKVTGLFECDLEGVFNSLFAANRTSEASYMLLGLQSILGPKEVRSSYNTRLMHMVATVLSVEKTRDDFVRLFESLLRFHNMVEPGCGFDVKHLVLTMFKENNFVGMYKLFQHLYVEPISLMEPMRSQLLHWYIWLICGSDSCQYTCDRIEKHRPTDSETSVGDVAFNVELHCIIIALRMQLSSCLRPEPFAMTGNRCYAMRMTQGLNSQVAPCMGITMCSYFYDIFIGQRLFVPAAAIAIACGDFLALSRIILMDSSVEEAVRSILSGESTCDNCVGKREFVKHCLVNTQKAFCF
ncbi:putative integral membrane protein [Babesia bovis T2Bo]|uniref:Uncharacterized protein n=1 Tax=Babesia bovis TaxID=5865 RepID=A7ASR8_BABBO|nr:putative integral membrane protein [Babesia bovis T2Bo]EDO05979.1 putative integral membrane protein [Babesia bovis T2Bo]|eukprot:XP_001609547.1 hypothetical protein [Babesia bovis T2Bo]